MSSSSFFGCYSEISKAYMLENVLIMKKLYDRGFDVSSYKDFEDPPLSSFLNIMFNNKVDWTEIEDPELPVEIDKNLIGDEDSFWSSSFDDFFDRWHASITINITDLEQLTGKLRPSQYKKMMSILEKLKGDFEIPEIGEDDMYKLYDEIFFPYDELFYNVSWTWGNGHIIGFNLDFVDLPNDWGEEPMLIGGSLDIFLEFWDALQEIKKEVAGNERLKRYCTANKPNQRYHVRRRKTGVNAKAKTNKPRFFVRNYRRVAGL